MGPIQLPTLLPLPLTELTCSAGAGKRDDTGQTRPTAAGVKLILKSPNDGPTFPATYKLRSIGVTCAMHAVTGQSSEMSRVHTEIARVEQPHRYAPIS